MLRMFLCIQSVRQIFADLFHELVVIFLIKLGGRDFKLLMSCFGGQIGQRSADFLDLLVSKLNGVQHLLF